MAGVRASVAGVDGCRAGWLVATGDVDGGGRPALTVERSFAAVAARVRAGELVAVAVDMPLGLPDEGPRACDRAARARLGPRRSSVFPTPARRWLGARSFDEVSGLSLQSWHLLPRVRDLDDAVDAALQDRVRETHPELVFARLLGGPAAHPKRTTAGRAERLAALGLARVPDVPAGAAPDDVLDALALLDAARRFAVGAGDHVGDGAVDARGLRMEIWW